MDLVSGSESKFALEGVLLGVMVVPESRNATVVYQAGTGKNKNHGVPGIEHADRIGNDRGRVIQLVYRLFAKRTSVGVGPEIGKKAPQGHIYAPLLVEDALEIEDREVGVVGIGAGIVEIEAIGELKTRLNHRVVADDLQRTGTLVDVEAVLVGQGQLHAPVQFPGQFESMGPTVVLSGGPHRVILRKQRAVQLPGRRTKKIV